MAEVTRIKATLQSSEKVSEHSSNLDDAKLSHTSFSILTVFGALRHVTHFRIDFLSDTLSHLPPLFHHSLSLSLFLPGVGRSEQLNDSSAGREGASDALREREGGGAVFSAAGCAGAAVVTSAGAREEQQGARRAAGQTAREGQSGQSSQAELSSVNSSLHSIRLVVFSSISGLSSSLKACRLMRVSHNDAEI